MNIRSKVPNRNTLVLEKAKKLVELVRYKVQSRITESSDDYMGELYTAFKNLFSALGSPLSAAFKLDPKEVRSPRKFSEFLLNLASDIDTLIESTNKLTQAAAEGFNFATARKNMLWGEINMIHSLSGDLQLLDDDLDITIMAAGDDFQDNDKIDRAASGDMSCDLLGGGLGIGLKRVGEVSAIDINKVKLYLPDKPEGSYEGHYYAPLGEAIPEGGEFHWEAASTDTAKTSTSGTTKSSKVASKVASAMKKVIDEATNPTSIKISEDITTEAPKTGTMLMDAGVANEEDPKLQAERRKMVDGDPDTFWQLEKSFDNSKLTSWENSKKVEAAAGVPMEVTINDLVDFTKNLDSMLGYDLKAAIIVDLGDTKTLNWISLAPLNLVNGAWLEINDVATSIDGNEYVSLPNLSEHMNERVITPEANEYLQPDEAAGILSDVSSFAGQGLWAFPPRVARFIKFDITQPTPIPSPYELTVVKFEQDVTITTTKKRKSKNWYGKARTKTSTDTEQKLLTYELTLDYERSVMLALGQSNLEQLVSGTEQTQTGTEGDLTVGKLTVGKRRTSTQWDITTGDWVSTDQYNIPRYNKLRYAIGIRDLYITSFSYAETSQFISVPFDFPKEINKVSLEVIERIPSQLRELDNEKAWIQYFVSFDDKVWTQIAPEKPFASHSADGNDLPIVININTDVPDELRNPTEGYIETEVPPTRLRFKAVFTRPSGDEYIAVGPVLESYRVKAFFRSGL